MPDICSVNLSFDPLFSYTFPDRPSFLTSFLCGGPPCVTFCWFKTWQSRQNDRRPKASRGMSAVFPRRARTYSSIIHTYLAFVKNDAGKCVTRGKMSSPQGTEIRKRERQGKRVHHGGTEATEKREGQVKRQK